MTQSQAYETLLKVAAQNHWSKAYEELMADGFLKDYDYRELLELWDADTLLQKVLNSLEQ